MPSNLQRRTAVVGVAVPAALGVVYVGGWALVAGLAVLGVVGTSELYRLAERGAVHPIREIGYPAAVLVPCLVFATARGGLEFDHAYVQFGSVIAMMSVMAFAAWRRGPAEKPLAAVSITVFGVLYASVLPAFLILIRHPAAPLSSWAATWLVFLPLVVIWLCDSAAMAGGSLIGGKKLAPVLSPNKTWAGAVVGGGVSVIVAPLYGRLLLQQVGVSLPVWQLMVFGLLVSTAGQVGDLAESLFKREVGVKDSGAFFPGHGGVLDRLDSLYWAIPTAVLLLTVFRAI